MMAAEEHVSGHRVGKVTIAIAGDTPVLLVLPASRRVDLAPDPVDTVGALRPVVVDDGDDLSDGDPRREVLLEDRRVVAIRVAVREHRPAT